MDNGHSGDPQLQNSEQRKLYRASADDRVLSGVCKGVADYFGIDSIYVMFGVVALSLFGFFFVPIIYLILWLVLPEEGNEEQPIVERAQENFEEVKTRLIGLFEQARDHIKTLGLTN